MTRFLLIGLAGAVGTWCRYLIALGASRLFTGSMPWGTFSVNVIGCFLISAIMHFALSTPHVSTTLRLLLTTGFLGGLTTYSSFNYETLQLYRAGALGSSIMYFALTTSICFVAGMLGLLAGKALVGG